MEDKQTKKDDELPKKINGDIDWDKYYEQVTPKLKEQKNDTEIEDKEDSPFIPEYSFDAFEIQPQIEIGGDIDPVNNQQGTIQPEQEDVDPDFQISIDEDPENYEENQEKELYLSPLPNEGDLFLIIIKENQEIIDKIISVENINKKENLISFKDEEENDILLHLNDDLNIILNSEEYKYEIIDFEKIEEFDIKNIDEEEIFLTKDIYPEIDLEVDEIKEKVYTIQEKKESLITELITLFKAYNNKTLIQNICEIAEEYETMLNNNKNKDFDYSDHLPFLKNVDKGGYKLPPWIIPITDNIKKLYLLEDEENKEEFEDTSYTDFEKELDTKDDIFLSEENTYQKYSKSFNQFTPFYNKKNGIIISHDGHYIRDCNDVNPCHGINGEYIFELNKTRKQFIIPLIKDSIPYYETVTPKEKISISGVYTIPHTDFDLSFKNTNILSLYEKSTLYNTKYSYLPMSKRLNYSEIIPHIIGPDTIKEDFINNSINSFIFDQFVSNENLNITLKNNLPNIKDILNNIPKNILSKVFNHKDLRKLLLPYGITYHLMDNNTKDLINKIIKKNTNQYILNYNKKIKRKVIKSIKKVNKLLSTDDKVQLSWSYIQSILIIPIKNTYIQSFIKRFSREPFDNENQNYLYQKDSENKLICKHYQYSSKIHNNSDAFISLKNAFGGTPNDGIISCNCCGEYLCHEDLSILEGFSDGAPKNTKEVLDTEKESLKALSDKQIENKKKINKISSLIGIELTEYDKQIIIDYLDKIKEEELFDIRYKNINAFKKHPEYKGLKKKYTFVKPAKTKQDKLNNKKNKELLDKDINRFKKYLINGNELLIIIFLILFNLQTSLPPYDFKGKLIINLWNIDDIKKESWSEISFSIHKKISMKTVNNVFNIIGKYSVINKSDIFWKDVKSFINEGDKYKDLIKIKAQFLQTAFFVLKDSNIRNKLKDYYNSKNNTNISLYLRENWSSYKPLYDNKIINDINNKINKQLKETRIKENLIKKGTTISYENISSIQELKTIYNTPKYKLLEIPYSDIMKNESYKRLLEYSIHLHGKSKESPTINLLINQLINTVDNGVEIEKMIEGIGWNKKTKSLKTIDFLKIRQLFLHDIQELFIKNNPEEKITFDSFNYIKINNWNGMLLNSTPKRIYRYQLPTVYPDKGYEELKNIYDTLIKEEEEGGEYKLNIIKSLFNNFCFNDEGEINKKMSHDDFILNIVADPSFEREISCSKDIKINKENYHKILEYNCKLYQFPLLNQTFETENIIEKRIHNFINTNGLLNYQGEDSYELLMKLDHLYNISNDNPTLVKKEYRETFNLVEDYKIKAIQNIKSFFIKSNQEGILRIDQMKYFKKNKGTLEQLDIYLNYYLENSENIENNISNLIYIIGRLSNNNIKEKEIGTILSDHIPKHWKLSDTNINLMKKFINNKEFLRHNDIFLDQKKYEGFYKYLEDEKYSICFKGLLDYIQGYYKGGIYELYGDDNSYYTKMYYKMFLRFYFVYLFEKLIEYIESLYDEQSLSSQKANELFLLLEEQDALELKDSIEQCSHLIFDLLNHFLDENNDTNWLFQLNDISDKLSRQKEIEKQNLINNLEGKTADQRLVTVELQTAGITNWYQDQSEANLERQTTTEYQEQLDNERINLNKEILLQKQTELEVTESFGINVNNLFIINEGQENKELNEAYSQRDEDYEEEGSDDPDIDGDYKEN